MVKRNAQYPSATNMKTPVFTGAFGQKVTTPISYQDQGCDVAEAVGFEPTSPSLDYPISSRGRYDHFDTLPRLIHYRKILPVCQVPEGKIACWPRASSCLQQDVDVHGERIPRFARNDKNGWACHCEEADAAIRAPSLCQRLTCVKPICDRSHRRRSSVTPC